jgi:GNAT superfamily N-acetyltransferase
MVSFSSSVAHARPGLAELLDVAFPGMGMRLKVARAWGVDWSLAVTGFVVPGPDGPLAHAGLLSLPIVVGGRPREVGYLHAVCTRPDHRGHGLARAVIEAALAASDEMHETQILLTSEPALYARFGFETVPEHGARYTLPAPAGGAQRGVPLPLEPTARGHTEALSRMARTRAPVSHALGVGPERAIYTLSECLSPVVWIEPLDVVVAWRMADGVLALDDVSGAKLPTLDDLLAFAPAPVRRVDFHFSPDRFLDLDHAAGLEWMPVARGPVLMARGRPLAAEGARIMLPPPWR